MPLSIGKFLLQIRQFYFYWSIEKSTNGIDGFWKISSKYLPMEKDIKVCFIFYIHHYTSMFTGSRLVVFILYVVGPLQWGGIPQGQMLKQKWELLYTLKDFSLINISSELPFE